MIVLEEVKNSGVGEDHKIVLEEDHRIVLEELEHYSVPHRQWQAQLLIILGHIVELELHTMVEEQEVLSHIAEIVVPVVDHIVEQRTEFVELHIVVAVEQQIVAVVVHHTLVEAVPLEEVHIVVANCYFLRQLLIIV
jgi:DNA-binding ferritin-like protein (Dps family)